MLRTAIGLADGCVNEGAGLVTVGPGLYYPAWVCVHWGLRDWVSEQPRNWLARVDLLSPPSWRTDIGSWVRVVCVQ